MSRDVLSDPRGTGASTSFCNTWASGYVHDVSGMVRYFSHVTGITGRLVQLKTNYYQLPATTNWQLCQYHVRFVPSEDDKNIKHKMLRDHKATLGIYLFDGTMLYASQIYEEDVSQIFFLFIICIMILKLVS